jgi:hypothetical protein
VILRSKAGANVGAFLGNVGSYRADHVEAGEFRC